MKRKLFILAATLLLSVINIEAQDNRAAVFGIDASKGPVPDGLKPGDKAPAFSGYDQQGTRIHSEKILEKGPIVLFFYRGKWCSACSKYLNNYQDSLNILADMGVNVVAVTPESIENVEQTVRFHKLTFTVIYDCQEQIMKDYRTYFCVTKDYSDRILKELSVDIAVNNSRDEAHLPVPATYIINRQGYITAVYFDPDFNNQASVMWIIRNLASAL